MAERDYYTVLGIDRGASADEIKRAYRGLARKLHPDVNPGDKQAEDRFKEVNAAYQILSDPERRAAHDQAPDRELEAEILKERRLQLKRRKKRLLGLY